MGGRRLPRVGGIGSPKVVEFAKNFTVPTTSEVSRPPPPPRRGGAAEKNRRYGDDGHRREGRSSRGPFADAVWSPSGGDRRDVRHPLWVPRELQPPEGRREAEGGVDGASTGGGVDALSSGDAAAFSDAVYAYEPFDGTSEWDDQDAAQWLMKRGGDILRVRAHSTSLNTRARAPCEDGGGRRARTVVRKGDLVRARLLRTFNEIKSVLNGAGRAGVGVRTYNIAIALAAQSGDTPLARAWFDEMQQNKHIRANAVVYNSVMHAHARDGDTVAITALWAAMEADGIQPTLANYATAIAAFAQTGDEAGALDVFSDLQDHPYLEASPMVYASVILACRSTARAMGVYRTIPRALRTEVVHNALVQSAAHAGEAAFAVETLQAKFLAAGAPRDAAWEVAGATAAPAVGDGVPITPNDTAAASSTTTATWWADPRGVPRDRDANALTAFTESHLARAPTWRACLHCLAVLDRWDLLQEVLVQYDPRRPCGVATGDEAAGTHGPAPFPPSLLKEALFAWRECHPRSWRQLGLPKDSERDAACSVEAGGIHLVLTRLTAANPYRGVLEDAAAPVPKRCVSGNIADVTQTWVIPDCGGGKRSRVVDDDAGSEVPPPPPPPRDRSHTAYKGPRKLPPLPLMM